MTHNYQDMMLAIVRKEQVPVTIFLTNGFQIRGKVCAFDAYAIIVEVDGKQQMVYKHAISTVAPMRSVLDLTVVDRVTVAPKVQPEGSPESETECLTTA
ncbi:MAG: RNA chaperone Hfq [Defluviitaleaceae bacterium]|nr:RNA chaperone Hfq [Defluviitaleaceae bacterium]